MSELITKQDDPRLLSYDGHDPAERMLLLHCSLESALAREAALKARAAEDTRIVDWVESTLRFGQGYLPFRWNSSIGWFDFFKGPEDTRYHKTFRQAAEVAMRKENPSDE